jgi:hypothetical protein
MLTQTISISFAAAVLGLVATPAVAQNAPATQGAATEKKVCRWLETRTGSQRKERVCLTATQWKQVEATLKEF